MSNDPGALKVAIVVLLAAVAIGGLLVWIVPPCPCRDAEGSIAQVAQASADLSNAQPAPKPKPKRDPRLGKLEAVSVDG